MDASAPVGGSNSGGGGAGGGAAAAPALDSREVFASYAWGPEEPPGSGVRPLQQRAHKVVAAIRKHTRADVWLDTERMGAQAQGDGGLADAMSAGIDACKFFVCCLSAAYAMRPNCKRELLYAYNSSKIILFVNVGEPGWLPSTLAGTPGKWLLLLLEDKLWADCRSDAAFASRDGVSVLLDELGPAGAAAPAATVITLSWADLTEPGPEIGRGAFGAVRRYRYHGTDVAVKELLGLAAALGDQADIDAFLREAELLSKLRHDHVIGVRGVAVDGEAGRYGLVTQLAEGSLEARVRRSAPRARLEFTRQIAAGLAYMHAQGVVHADVKLANVLVLVGGRGVAVADFGFAAAKQGISSISSAGGHKGAGTAAFKAPELLEIDADGNFAHSASKASDVYAFGVAAFCLLAGIAAPYPARDPKTGKSISIDHRVPMGMRPTDFRALPSPPDVPEAAVRLIAACWAHRREERPSMAAALVELESCVAATGGLDAHAAELAAAKEAAAAEVAAMTEKAAALQQSNARLMQQLENKDNELKAAGVLVDNAVRERDAAHTKAMAEAKAKAKAALDKVEMAAALERSRSRQLADKNSAEIADLSGEDPDLHFDARRRQGPRQADRAHHPRPAPRHPAPRASVPTSSLLLPSPSSCAPQ